MLRLQNLLFLVTCPTFFADLRTNAFEITDSLNDFGYERVEITAKQLRNLDAGDRKVQKAILQQVNGIVKHRMKIVELHELKLDQPSLELQNASIVLDHVLLDKCTFKLTTRKGSVDVKTLLMPNFTTG